MSIAVAIPNHNQHETVINAINRLMAQTTPPDIIYVMSDAKPFYTDCPRVRHLVNANRPGRCSNRNSVIKEFLDSGLDYLVFIDGDCSPKGKDFIDRYIDLLGRHDLVFGTRQHTDVKSNRTMKRPASDLLTANMDNMWLDRPLDYTDLRVVSGAVKAWQDSRSLQERADLMLTGMIGWSCNFGFNRKGLVQLCDFMADHYGMRNEIFDSAAFKDGWGYEDVAMGLDAMYAGLDVLIDESVPVMHKSHERSDGLFDHVKGRHIIMERYRSLQAAVERKDMIYIAMMVLFAFYMAGIICGMCTMAGFSEAMLKLAGIIQ